MITKQNNEIFSTEGKYVHIIGTDSYFKRGLAIGLSVEQCEAEAREWLKEHPNGDLPPLPQVEEVTDYLSETTDDVVGFGQ